MKQDEQDVQQIIQTCADWCVNPFMPSSSISFFSSGSQIDDSVTKAILSAEKVGEEAASSFISKHIQSSHEDFYAPIRKIGIEFLIKPKEKKVTVQDRDMVVKSDRNLFVQMTIIGLKQKLGMKKVIKYPLNPIPPSLKTTNG